MGRGPSTFKRSDVRRAIKAVESAGIAIARVEIEGGRISIVPADVGEKQIESEAGDWVDAAE
jgi:hypothetical protein